RTIHGVALLPVKADLPISVLQRALALYYQRIADVLMAQGNLTGALQSFRDGLAIAERLAQADPSNWHRDLGISYRQIGDVLVAQGNLTEALPLQEALAVRRGEV